MDIIIEDTKATMEQWGAKPPTFLLCNPKLTFAMTMSPTATEYVTHGPDGQKKLAAGPNINTYRGLQIIKTRTFALEDGAMPRDVLRRRCRTAEFYLHTVTKEYDEMPVYFELYDEASDQFNKINVNSYMNQLQEAMPENLFNTLSGNATHIHYLVVRPHIEHEMHGVIIGRGGLEDLGCTFWGQTELSVYDDAMHGIWGMSYKYNERAVVLNNKHLMRVWDTAYDSYTGGKDLTVCEDFKGGDKSYSDLYVPYHGKSIWIVPIFSKQSNFTESYFQLNMEEDGEASVPIAPEQEQMIKAVPTLVSLIRKHMNGYEDDNITKYINWVRTYLPDLSTVHIRKPAGHAANENETSVNSIAFKGTYRVYEGNNKTPVSSNNGCGHHGTDYVGVASARSSKGVRSMVAGIGAPTFLPAPPTPLEVKMAGT